MEASSKRFTVAVALSGIFGLLGIHHFYLGRHLEGMLDCLMTIAAFLLFVEGHLVLSFIILGIDILHTLIIAILLLTGALKDGQGKIVCYPGQRLSN